MALSDVIYLYLSTFRSSEIALNHEIHPSL